MTDFLIFLPFSLPIILALIIFLVPKNDKFIKESVSMIAVTANLVITIILFGKDIIFNIPWLEVGRIKIDFALKLYQFSSFILLASAGFSFLIVLYSLVFMKGKNSLRQFYSFLLLTVGFVNGAVLANNLVLMLFFWEGLLVTMFAMIMTGGKASFKTAVKTFVLVGISDLFLMLGIGLVAYIGNGELAMDKITHLPADNFLSIFAFIMLMTGAVSKAGSMPFHSWIPDAATDAPLPFMAFLPASLEKLLGIYFLARISLDFFKIEEGSSMSMVMMSVGAITIILAVMMALIQKDYKRLLSYHAISQVGYMILGIGTAVPVGIVGGIFHMINHAMYKSGLFLTGGSVEKQTGTTDLTKLGGLARQMPITCICFIITACSISGVFPFNGFFSKELVFDGAFETGKIFYIAAVLGALLTAASFLKLGHAAFFGQKGEAVNDKIKDPSWTMLVPMIIIAGFCILFGVYNKLPLQNLIQPILGERLEGHDFSGFHPNWLLVGISTGVLLLAIFNHIFGVRRTKKGIGAVDHIHYAPVLSTIYNWAEKGYFDPYNITMWIVNGVSRVFFWIDRGIDLIYNVAAVKTAEALSFGIRKAHNGSHSMYILWSVIGLVVLLIIFVRW